MQLYILDQDLFLGVIKTVTRDQIINYHYICTPDSAYLSFTTKLSRPEMGIINGQHYVYADWDFFFQYNIGLQSIYHIVDSQIQAYAPEMAQLFTHQISLRQGTYTPVHFHVTSEIYLHPNPEPVGFLVDVAITALTL